jgi:hypothetical protein
MTHHPAFSTRVRNQEVTKVPGHGVACPSAIHGTAAGSPAAKIKGLPHDSAFLAERGCLGAAKLPGRPLPG